jgi:hypothetical protein
LESDIAPRVNAVIARWSARYPGGEAGKEAGTGVRLEAEAGIGNEPSTQNLNEHQDENSISRAGRSDLQARLENDIAPRVNAVNGKQTAIFNTGSKSAIRTDAGIGIDELKNSGQRNDGRGAELRPIQSEFNQAIHGQGNLETGRQQQSESRRDNQPSADLKYEDSIRKQGQLDLQRRLERDIAPRVNAVIARWSARYPGGEAGREAGVGIEAERQTPTQNQNEHQDQTAQFSAKRKGQEDPELQWWKKSEPADNEGSGRDSEPRTLAGKSLGTTRSDEARQLRDGLMTSFGQTQMAGSMR